MESITTPLHSLFILLTRLFDPLMTTIARFNFFVDQQLIAWGTPILWRPWLLALLWTLILALMVRLVSGWLRLVLLIFIAIVLARVYGVMPMY